MKSTDQRQIIYNYLCSQHNVKIQKVSETFFTCFHLTKTRSRFNANLLMLRGYIKNGLGILVYDGSIWDILNRLMRLLAAVRSLKKPRPFTYLEGFDKISKKKITAPWFM